MKRCLYCYQLLDEGQIDFHPKCSKKMFGQPTPPEIPFEKKQMKELALKLVQSQITVTGVQPKLSLHLSTDGKKSDSKRFTIVGLWRGYILKPPSISYPEMPEVESLTMHLASIAKIKVVPQCLIRLKSGELAYITKRIDRIKPQKIHMEDMCQLTDRLTENKYLASHEQVAKAILNYSSTPMLDVVNFYELVLFSFLTGNADMHLKNFSLIYGLDVKPVLSPAYDLLATTLVNPTDNEDLALTLNGKKRKIKRSDFTAAFSTSMLEEKQQQNIFQKMVKAKDKWMNMIDISFLSDDFKQKYKTLINDRFTRIS
jgi:serine/threonine-protein kinase HipA